eukprot:50483-Pyramimonas_sp.AAC.1
MGSSRWSAASPCNAAKQLTFNALQQFDSHGGRHLEVEGKGPERGQARSEGIRRGSNGLYDSSAPTGLDGTKQCFP